MPQYQPTPLYKIQRTCAYEPCGKIFYARKQSLEEGKGNHCCGTCRNLARPKEDVRERFWRQVQIGAVNECWPWQGAIVDERYGHFSLSPYKAVKAHRYALEEKLGRPLGECMMSLHTCDRPACCNPEHLFEGTSQDNVDDMIKKGRKVAARGEGHGMAKLKESQVLEIRKLLEEGLTQSAIASKYEISQIMVSQIKRRVSWAYL